MDEGAIPSAAGTRRAAGGGAVTPQRIDLDIAGLGGEAARRLPGRVRALIAGREDAPAVIVLGGISATAAVVAGEDGSAGWWSRLFGPGRQIDPADYRIVGIDFLADDEGRYAPSTQEQAAIIDAAAVALGGPPHAIVGASYGGMVALAWATRGGASATRLAIVSANAAPHPMATASRWLQRRVVALGLANGCAAEALEIARAMGMLTYRTAAEFGQRFSGGTADGDPLAATSPGDYLAARGRAFVEAVPPGRFLSLSASIDRHRVDPALVLNPALVVAVEEDALVPLAQCEELAATLGGPARLERVRSIYGHDAFLKEEPIGRLIADFLGEGR